MKIGNTIRLGQYKLINFLKDNASGLLWLSVVLVFAVPTFEDWWYSHSRYVREISNTATVALIIVQVVMCVVLIGQTIKKVNSK